MNGLGKYRDLFNYLSSDPFYVQAPVSLEVYSEIPVEEAFFHPFVLSSFRRAGIHKLGQLLRMNYSECNDKLGQLETYELVADLSDFLQEGPCPPGLHLRDPQSVKTSPLPASVKEHGREIVEGDFRFTKRSFLTKEEWEETVPYLEAYKILGPELAAECYLHPEKFTGAASALKEARYMMNVVSPRRRSLSLMAGKLPAEMKDKPILPYLQCFVISPREEILLSYAEDETLTMGDFPWKVDVSDPEHFLIAGEFYRWCTYRLKSLARDIRWGVLKDPMIRVLLRKFAEDDPQKWTQYQVTGTTLEVLRLPAFLSRLRLELGGGPVVPVSALQGYFGDATPSVVELYKIAGKDFFYTFSASRKAFLFKKLEI